MLVPEAVAHPRQQLLLAIGTRLIADQALLLGQLLIEAERILPTERPEAALLRAGGLGDDVHASPSVCSGAAARPRGRADTSMNAGVSPPNPRTGAPVSSSRRLRSRSRPRAAGSARGRGAAASAG